MPDETRAGLMAEDEVMIEDELMMKDALVVRAYGLTQDGLGVARADNRVVFVEGLLPGERARVRVTARHKNFWRAEAEEVLPDEPRSREEIPYTCVRQVPVCSAYGRCGGCVLQHMSYADTLYWKRRWVEDAMARIAGADVRVQAVMGMKEPWRYRNKAVLHWDGTRLGWYAARSHEVVEFTDCRLLSHEMNEKVRTLKGELAERAAEPVSVTLREDEKGVMADAGQTSWRDGRLMYHADKLVFGVSPRSFVQVNTEQMRELMEVAAQMAGLSGDEKVWDLYCGVGVLGLRLAGEAAEVVGVEENPQAVRDAAMNARRNGIENARFCVDKAEDFLPRCEEKISIMAARPGLVIVDPPRAGLSRKVTESLRRLGPKRILYVSCDPATLARDVGRLMGSEKGLRNGEEGEGAVYRVLEVKPVDMFPWTSGVECVVLMVRMG